MERKNKTHRCRHNISSQLYDVEGHIQSNYSVISVKTKKKTKQNPHISGVKRGKKNTFCKERNLTGEVVPHITSIRASAAQVDPGNNNNRAQAEGKS